jgi:hypothetical protein
MNSQDFFFSLIQTTGTVCEKHISPFPAQKSNNKRNASQEKKQKKSD